MASGDLISEDTFSRNLPRDSSLVGDSPDSIDAPARDCKTYGRNSFSAALETAVSDANFSASSYPEGCLSSSFVQAPLQKLWELERLEMARQREELRSVRGELRGVGPGEHSRYR